MALSGAVFAQTAAVTKNPTTNAVNGGLLITGTNTLTVDGTLRTGTPTVLLDSTAGINFGTVGSTLLATGKNRHAIIARTPLATDGIALVGWSSSGASAVKALQDTHFTSPALTVYRDTNLGGTLSTSPGVLIASAGSGAGPNSFSAAEVQVSGTTRFKITWEGQALSNNRPLTRWRGSGSSFPSTDIMEGDLWLQTGGVSPKMWIRTGGDWVPLN